MNICGKRFEGVFSDSCEAEGQEDQDFTQSVQSRPTKKWGGNHDGKLYQNREQVMQGTAVKPYWNFEKVQGGSMISVKDMWQGVVVDKSGKRLKKYRLRS